METLKMAFYNMTISGIFLLEPITTGVIVVVVGGFLIWAGYKIYQSVKQSSEKNKEKMDDVTKDH